MKKITLIAIAISALSCPMWAQFTTVSYDLAFLEGLNTPNAGATVADKKIMVRPYVGLSARIDLSLRLGK